MDPAETGKAFVEHRFGDALAAFVAGSWLRDEATETSDLDIVVIADRADAPYRVSFRELGWPIEAFVHTLDSLRWYFMRDAAGRTPSLPMMCAEGAIVRDQELLAYRIKADAQGLIERGPAPLDREELLTRRYALTDLLDDFLGCRSPDEGLIIAGQLAVQSAELVLLLNRRWLGKGKWLIRALRRFDPELARRLNSALQTYYQVEDKDDLIRFADGVLTAAGGRLFEGYYSPGPSPDNP